MSIHSLSAARLSLLALLPAAILAPAGGCSFLTPLTPAPERASAKKRFVLILLDETSSMKQYWPDMVRLAAEVVKGLQEGEGLGVIGIDDKGYDQDDARLEMRVLPDDLRALETRRRWAQEVAQLQPRSGKRPFTDIVGALRHAEYFLSRQTEHRPVLVLFSDMQQTPRMPSPDGKELAGLRFPSETTASCLFVNATDWRDGEGLIQLWKDIFARTGVTIEEKDFCQKGNAGMCVARLQPEGPAH
jgi:hypothetical protein